MVLALVLSISQLTEEALLGNRLDSHDWEKISNVNVSQAGIGGHSCSSASKPSVVGNWVMKPSIPCALTHNEVSSQVCLAAGNGKGLRVALPNRQSAPPEMDSLHCRLAAQMSPLKSWSQKPLPGIQWQPSQELCLWYGWH